MSLHEEAERYRKLSGDYNPKTPISRIGGYLDGYECAMQEFTADPDTISRAQVLETFSDLYFIFDDYKEIQKKFDAVYEKLQDLPPSPSRPHGQWIKAKDLSGEYYYCSNCKEELPRVATESATWDNPYPTEYSIDTTDFCPHCGADMRGGAV